VRLEFRGTQFSSDSGLLVMRELDAARLCAEARDLTRAVYEGGDAALAT